MIFTNSSKETYLPAYPDDHQQRISYAIGNREIGLLFGTRGRLSVMWKMYVNVKNEIVLEDEVGVGYVLGIVTGIVKLSFTFDPFSFPIMAVQVKRGTFTGIEVYKFTNHGGAVIDKILLLTLSTSRSPKLVPTNISDLGSILNQPLLIYIDPVGDVVQRSNKTNFTELDGLPIVKGLLATDELRRAGITTSGKVQLEFSKLKKVI